MKSFFQGFNATIGVTVAIIIITLLLCCFCLTGIAFRRPETQEAWQELLQEFD